MLIASVEQDSTVWDSVGGRYRQGEQQAGGELWQWVDWYDSYYGLEQSQDW